MSSNRYLRSLLTRLGAWSASPIAFTIVIGYAAFWVVFEHETFDWHAVATLATWLMTLVITRAEHRDTQALHAKLDELLRAQTGARSELSGLDDQEPEDIERHREHARAGDVVAPA